MPPSYQEIATTADAQVAAQQALERSINSEINRIKDKEWNGPLSDSDRNDLQQLREVKAALLATMEELAFVTVGALDKTDEVKRIANAIQSACKTLEDELSDIAHIATVANTTSKILGGLSDVQGKLSGVIGQG